MEESIFHVENKNVISLHENDKSPPRKRLPDAESGTFTILLLVLFF
jgi:hypothetical protein